VRPRGRDARFRISHLIRRSFPRRFQSTASRSTSSSSDFFDLNKRPITPLRFRRFSAAGSARVLQSRFLPPRYFPPRFRHRR
jgi:hypothetical protein